LYFVILYITGTVYKSWLVSVLIEYTAFIYGRALGPLWLLVIRWLETACWVQTACRFKSATWVYKSICIVIDTNNIFYSLISNYSYNSYDCRPI